MGSSGETAMGKITIGEASDGGADGLLVSCEGSSTTTGGCRRSAKLTMMRALALWGRDARLDALPLYCAACGSRKVEVRPNYPYAPSSGLDELMRNAWDRKR
jgi:hypothetical protein